MEIDNDGDKYILNKLHEFKNIPTYKKFFKNPIETIHEKPPILIYISLCFTIFFIIIGKLVFNLYIGDIIISSILISITPFGLYHSKNQKRIKEIHENFPSLFRDIARAKKSGMSLQNAISLTSNGDYGILNKSLQEMNLWLSWNMPFKDALEQFNKRHNTPLINRSIFTILAAYRIGGDVGIVMEKVADDAHEYMLLNKKREMETAPYLAVGYISFFVFMIVIIILQIFFLPMMHLLDMADSAQALEVILFHALIIQGFCIGIFIGKIGKHSIYAGIKHSIILVIMAYVAYVIAVIYL
ncbi:MAG: type II secretion system F family protein [Methanosarcinales archaeon]|nr:type II secretion system F family protein [Methanosarcinales archaeon]